MNVATRKNMNYFSREGLTSLFLWAAPTVLVLLACLSINTVLAQDGASQTYTREIVIRPGDTLSHIALRELGSAKLAERVATFNQVSLEKILKPGDKILIPITLPVRDEFATVLFVKGEVTLNGDDAKKDDEVRLNDTLTTGSTGFASLTFETGTLINLQPNTIARLITLFCQPDDETCVIEMAADQGTITTDVRRSGEQPTDFRVQTPYASAAVRGTIFDIEADNTGLRVGVTEGEVALQAPDATDDSDESVGLEEGFGSVTKLNGPIGQPVALLPPPVFRFIPPRIAAGDSVRWFGLTDTQNYAVQISEQDTGVGVVFSSIVNEDTLTIAADLPAGDHTLWVRAIDPDGLRGFNTSSPVSLAILDAAAPVVETNIERQGDEYLISVLNPPEDSEGFEVQIASDADFLDTVSIDIDPFGQAIVKLESDTIFARARILIDRSTVGAFGAATSISD